MISNIGNADSGIWARSPGARINNQPRAYRIIEKTYDILVAVDLAENVEAACC
jgi:hypothetical protein